jgi:hypothetical protein
LERFWWLTSAGGKLSRNIPDNKQRCSSKV